MQVIGIITSIIIVFFLLAKAYFLYAPCEWIPLESICKDRIDCQVDWYYPPCTDPDFCALISDGVLPEFGGCKEK